MYGAYFINTLGNTYESPDGNIGDVQNICINYAKTLLHLFGVPLDRIDDNIKYDPEDPIDIDFFMRNYFLNPDLFTPFKHFWTAERTEEDQNEFNEKISLLLLNMIQIRLPNDSFGPNIEGLASITKNNAVYSYYNIITDASFNEHNALEADYQNALRTCLKRMVFASNFLTEVDLNYSIGKSNYKTRNNESDSFKKANTDEDNKIRKINYKTNNNNMTIGEMLLQLFYRCRYTDFAKGLYALSLSAIDISYYKEIPYGEDPLIKDEELTIGDRNYGKYMTTNMLLEIYFVLIGMIQILGDIIKVDNNSNIHLNVNNSCLLNFNTSFLHSDDAEYKIPIAYTFNISFDTFSGRTIYELLTKYITLSKLIKAQYNYSIFQPIAATTLFNTPFVLSTLSKISFDHIDQVTDIKTNDDGVLVLSKQMFSNIVQSTIYAVFSDEIRSFNYYKQGNKLYRYSMRNGRYHYSFDKLITNTMANSLVTFALCFNVFSKILNEYLHEDVDEFNQIILSTGSEVANPFSYLLSLSAYSAYSFSSKDLEEINDKFDEYYTKTTYQFDCFDETDITYIFNLLSCGVESFETEILNKRINLFCIVKDDADCFKLLIDYEDHILSEMNKLSGLIMETVFDGSKIILLKDLLISLIDESDSFKISYKEFIEIGEHLFNFAYDEYQLQSVLNMLSKFFIRLGEKTKQAINNTYITFPTGDIIKTITMFNSILEGHDGSTDGSTDIKVDLNKDNVSLVLEILLSIYGYFHEYCEQLPKFVSNSNANDLYADVGDVVQIAVFDENDLMMFALSTDENKLYRYEFVHRNEDLSIELNVNLPSTRTEYNHVYRDVFKVVYKPFSQQNNNSLFDKPVRLILYDSKPFLELSNVVYKGGAPVGELYQILIDSDEQFAIPFCGINQFCDKINNEDTIPLYNEELNTIMGYLYNNEIYNSQEEKTGEVFNPFGDFTYFNIEDGKLINEGNDVVGYCSIPVYKINSNPDYDIDSNPCSYIGELRNATILYTEPNYLIMRKFCDEEVNRDRILLLLSNVLNKMLPLVEQSYINSQYVSHRIRTFNGVDFDVEWFNHMDVKARLIIALLIMFSDDIIWLRCEDNEDAANLNYGEIIIDNIRSFRSINIFSYTIYALDKFQIKGSIESESQGDQYTSEMDYNDSLCNRLDLFKSNEELCNVYYNEETFLNINNFNPDGNISFEKPNVFRFASINIDPDGLSSYNDGTSGKQFAMLNETSYITINNRVKRMAFDVEDIPKEFYNSWADASLYISQLICMMEVMLPSNDVMNCFNGYVITNNTASLHGFSYHMYLPLSIELSRLRSVLDSPLLTFLQEGEICNKSICDGYVNEKIGDIMSDEMFKAWFYNRFGLSDNDGIINESTGESNVASVLKTYLYCKFNETVFKFVDHLVYRGDDINMRMMYYGKGSMNYDIRESSKNKMNRYRYVSAADMYFIATDDNCKDILEGLVSLLNNIKVVYNKNYANFIKNVFSITNSEENNAYVQAAVDKLIYIMQQTFTIIASDSTLVKMGKKMVTSIVSNCIHNFISSSLFDKVLVLHEGNNYHSFSSYGSSLKEMEINKRVEQTFINNIEGCQPINDVDGNIYSFDKEIAIGDNVVKVKGLLEQFLDLFYGSDIPGLMNESDINDDYRNDFIYTFALLRGFYGACKDIILESVGGSIQKTVTKFQ